jgi:hypothetical protein
LEFKVSLREGLGEVVFGGEVEGGEVGLEEGLVELLLLEYTGDIAEMALVLGLCRSRACG